MATPPKRSGDARAAPAGKGAATGKATPSAPVKGAATAKSGEGTSGSAHRQRLLRRVISGGKVAAVLLVTTLLCGVLGYRYIAQLSWLIAFHQASLLLAGMGPVVTDLSDSGRVFESFYAMFCGVMLLGSTGILFTPFIHHMLHAFHVEDTAEPK